MMAFYCVGNWKMNKSPLEATDFCSQLKTKTSPEERPHLIILPSPILSQAVSGELKSSGISWGGQNCYYENRGAFTGETSPEILQTMGAQYCLVGHSERRQIFLEGDELLAKKMKSLQMLGITPILCVGETLDDRKWNRTEEVVLRQLREGLSQTDLSKPVWIAYEPVWAIGTGQVATVEQVHAVHDLIRKYLVETTGSTGTMTPILYGGSVKPDNASDLSEIKNVNGFLIGGASLNVAEFLLIYRNSKK